MRIDTQDRRWKNTDRDAGRVRIDFPLGDFFFGSFWGFGPFPNPAISDDVAIEGRPGTKTGWLDDQKHEIQNALKGRREGRPNHPVNHVFSAPACASIASFVVSAASVIKPGG
jgi:hypothetical protein